ncbi:hypothetical protein [Paenibacillus albus]|nr:hypothetical protein [Paenibacillus albus]
MNIAVQHEALLKIQLVERLSLIAKPLMALTAEELNIMAHAP